MNYSPRVRQIVETELRRSPALNVLMEGLIDEIERLRRLEYIVIAQRHELEAGNKYAIAKVLRWIEFNGRMEEGPS